MSKPYRWNGPGDVKNPIVIATAKSSNPKAFHHSPARRPLAVPDATARATGKAMMPVAMEPMDEKDATENAIDLQGNEPRRRRRIEQHRDRARPQQRRQGEDQWKKD